MSCAIATYNVTKTDAIWQLDWPLLPHDSLKIGNHMKLTYCIYNSNTYILPYFYKRDPIRHTLEVTFFQSHPPPQLCHFINAKVKERFDDLYQTSKISRVVQFKSQKIVLDKKKDIKLIEDHETVPLQSASTPCLKGAKASK